MENKTPRIKEYIMNASSMILYNIIKIFYGFVRFLLFLIVLVIVYYFLIFLRKIASYSTDNYFKANLQNYDRVLDYVESNNIRYVGYNYFEYWEINYSKWDNKFICSERDRICFIWNTYINEYFRKNNIISVSNRNLESTISIKKHFFLIYSDMYIKVDNENYFNKKNTSY